MESTLNKPMDRVVALLKILGGILFIVLSLSVPPTLGAAFIIEGKFLRNFKKKSSGISLLIIGVILGVADVLCSGDIKYSVAVITGYIVLGIIAPILVDM